MSSIAATPDVNIGQQAKKTPKDNQLTIFKPGTIVYAKVLGFPAWPAKVLRITKQKTLVYFYGPGSEKYSWVQPKDLSAFDEENAPNIIQKLDDSSSASPDEQLQQPIVAPSPVPAGTSNNSNNPLDKKQEEKKKQHDSTQLQKLLKLATEEALNVLRAQAEHENEDICYACRNGGLLILCDGYVHHAEFFKIIFLFAKKVA